MPSGFFNLSRPDPQLESSVAVHEDIQYCRQEKCRSCSPGNSIKKHRLDLFLPQQACSSSPRQSPPPLVFFVHGGGWRRGHKNGWKHYLSSYDTNLLIYLLLRLFGVYNNVGRAFSKAGYACVVPSYRLSRTPMHLFAFELFISLFLSLGTILPFLAGLYLLVCWVWVGKSGQHTGCDLSLCNGCLREECEILPLWTCLDACVVFLWLIISARFKSYGRAAIVLMWSFLACLLAHAYVTSDRFEWRLPNDPFTSGLLLVATYAVLLATYWWKHGQERCAFRESLEDVATAFQWAVRYGRDSGLYDPEQVYVSGHSAGAHLGMMMILQKTPHLLSPVGPIRGFIGMCGAYDITQMTHWLSQQLYIKPAFGSLEDDASWLSNSPIHLLPGSRSGCGEPEQNTQSSGTAAVTVSERPLPPCLLLTAVADFGLGIQAERLAALLKQQGCKACHMTLPNHNHFSVISLFGQSVLSNLLSRTLLRSREDPWNLCVSFMQAHR